MSKEYAHALMHTHSPENQVESFIAVLKRHGKLKALPAIVRELERVQQTHESHEPTLFVAKEAHVASAQEELRARGVTANPRIIIDRTLIGKWRYVGDHTLLDTSYKKSLLTLYRRITNRI